ADESKGKYSLIIGNPPYINKKNMAKEDIDKAKALCKTEKLEVSAMQNMWLAFVVGASRLLLEEGTIFFVLPMEFLQVQYAEKLRIHLESK
ncbi:MAG: Eco57I restriction-modification methylase domain-containing protein, partial [Lachnospiraceae bacterium]|nr:Eco57I restriction-modification methylase domain-containing protein [Lachnospiraceae bacterium]